MSAVDPEKGMLLSQKEDSRESSQHEKEREDKKQMVKPLLIFFIAYCVLQVAVVGGGRLRDYLAAHRCPHHHHGLPSDGEYDMSRAPVGELIEHKCWPDGEGYYTPPATKCYRMSAPLDYTNSTDPRRANIALARYPAGGGKTPRSKVLGTVFFNPGGPGGSGIEFITRTGAKYNGSSAVYFDSFFESRYDIMSFDPRGVSRTWPRADCFQDPLESYADGVLTNGGGLLHSSSAAAPRAIAHNKLIGQLCKKRLGDVLPHVTTAAVVKDMNLMRQAVGDDKLNYAGFSYGTVLGSYFADIFPEYVGHLWLDGVVDVPNYQSGSWDDNLVDFEDVLRGFFSTCVAAGSDKCALARLIPKEISDDHAKAADFLARKMNEQVEELRAMPVAVPEGRFPGLATYIDYKNGIFHQMYAPTTWPQLASLSHMAQAEDIWHPFLEEFGMKKYKKPLQGTYASPDASYAIACSDATEHSDHEWTVEDYVRGEKKLAGESPFAAEIWIQYESMCQGAYDIKGADVWRGSFNSTPANPILFGSNTYDPVTPLMAARKMRDSFGGRNKLFHVENGYGHCTIALPSKCAQNVVADWFVRDKLPEEDEKLCQLDAPPFAAQPSPVSVAALSALSEEERVQVMAAEGVNGVVETFRHWRQDSVLPL